MGADRRRHLRRLQVTLPWLNRIQEGTVVNYRFAGNPSKTLWRPGDRLHGKRVHLWDDDADQWWLRKAQQHGLTVRTVISRPHRDGTQPRRNDKPAVVHNAVQFDGIAVVSNVDTVRGAMVHGIGRGRAHGLGLLSLAPAGAG